MTLSPLSTVPVFDLEFSKFFTPHPFFSDCFACGGKVWHDTPLSPSPHKQVIRACALIPSVKRTHAMMWRERCPSRGWSSSLVEHATVTKRNHFIPMNMHGDSLLNAENTHDDRVMSSMVDELSHQTSKRA